MRVDIDGDSFTTTDTVGAALSAFEAPAVDRSSSNARALKPAAGAGKVRLAAGRSTPEAPKGFWKTVAQVAHVRRRLLRGARARATRTRRAPTQQSLVAESTRVGGPDGTWAGAPRGLEFAEASLQDDAPVLDGVSVKVEPVTLPGLERRHPHHHRQRHREDAQRARHRDLERRRARERQTTIIQTTLPPQETYLEMPVDMQTGLSGKLIVEVSAGGLVLARKTVTVRASLSRPARDWAAQSSSRCSCMLVFIVRRTRAAEADER